MQRANEERKLNHRRDVADKLDRIAEQNGNSNLHDVAYLKLYAIRDDQVRVLGGAGLVEVLHHQEHAALLERLDDGRDPLADRLALGRFEGLADRGAADL